jgi:hypothetical protein
MRLAEQAQPPEGRAVVDGMVNLGDRPGHHRPGRKVLTLVHALAAGADGIDDTDVLRTGSTAEVLGHQVMAPSTLGTFLRSFTFGHVRQLDRVAEAVMGRAWAAGAGPGTHPMTIDLDSTVCEVHGHHKGGAAYGYTRLLGDHPLLATRADTGEVLHARQRTGRAASGRGAERFVNETAGRVRRAGASGQLTVGADSGFWSAKVLAACRRHNIRFSITVRQTPTVTTAIAAVGERAWIDIDHPDGGIAQVAETTLGADRLVVRRTRLVAPRPRCGRTGASTPSSPTVKAARWSWTSTTAAMPLASLPSATSSMAPGCATAPQAASWPTRPGWSLPPSPTTCCAGSPPSGSAPAARSSPRPCADAYWRCPAGSPARPAGAGCTCQPTGHGPPSSSARWPAYGQSHCGPDRPAPPPPRSQRPTAARQPAPASDRRILTCCWIPLSRHGARLTTQSRPRQPRPTPTPRPNRRSAPARAKAAVDPGLTLRRAGAGQCHLLPAPRAAARVARAARL